jgi:hypothetical protein
MTLGRVLLGLLQVVDVTVLVMINDDDCDDDDDDDVDYDDGDDGDNAISCVFFAIIVTVFTATMFGSNTFRLPSHVTRHT